MKVRWLLTVLSAAALVLATIGTAGPGIGQAEETEQAGAGDRGIKPGGESVRAAKTARLALDYNPRTAEVTVTDLLAGTVWSSNPVDRESDGIAKGVKKQDLNAQLLLDYIDPLGKPFQLNSFTGSVQQQAFTWKAIEGGVEVLYEFPKAGFVIPVAYSIQGDAFVATIQADRIEKRGKYQLVNVYLLPFFGAGNLNDEGYLFVPDGSGALIRFNNNKSIYRSYNERVYGGDQAIAMAEQTRVTETVRLPVFGMKRNDEGFLAVIHHGAYQAGILAESSRKSNQYNSVSSYLNLTEFETNILMAGSLNEKAVVRPSSQETGNLPYEVRYYFLSGDKADYAGMAERYRQYLTEEQGVKTVPARSDDSLPLMLELLGGVKKRDTFLGIPYGTVETLTSYKDVESIAGRLIEDGLTNLAIRYEGWAAGGMKDEVPVSLDAEGNLGGDKAFRRLIRSMEDQGIALYPVVDPIHLYENGNGFSKFADAAKNISRAPALRSAYRISNGTKDPSVKPWYLLKPESVREAVVRFAKNAERSELDRAAIQGIGSVVYSDYRRGALSKNETGQIWEASLETAAGKLDGLSIDRANAYAFPAAESLTNVPLTSSGFDIQDEAIPFYSMAVSGLIPAYSEPINLMGNTRAYLLKLIETGTLPAYRYIARDGSLLIGTDYEGLYSGNLALWYDDMLAHYEELNAALTPVVGQPIVEHEKLAEGVYRTTFGNGIAAVVNYTGEAVTVERETIDPYGYLIR
jgi:hypothetical protein